MYTYLYISRNPHARLHLGSRQVQKIFHSKFKEALLPPSIETLLASRFVKHFVLVSKTSCPKAAQPYFAMAAPKTLLNSWCARSRYHEVGPDVCIFGCDCAEDDISYHATCPTLWQVTCQAAQVPLSSKRLDASVTAFTVYPDVELGRPGARVEARRLGNYTTIQSIMMGVASSTHAIKFGLAQTSARLGANPT